MTDEALPPTEEVRQNFPKIHVVTLSNLPSRVRLRFAPAEEGRRFLERDLVPAKVNRRFNPRLGTLVLDWDPSEVSRSALDELMESSLIGWARLARPEVALDLSGAIDLSGESSAPNRSKPNRRKWESSPWSRVYKLGAAAGLTTSVLALFSGSRRLHAVSGGVGVGFVLLHTLVHRRNVLR